VIFRRLLLIVSVSLAGSAYLLAETRVMPADEINLIRTFTGWREAASFKRISEYFDGQENTQGEVVLRSQPDQRGGLLFYPPPD
jgi:hypothetical protein